MSELRVIDYAELTEAERRALIEKTNKHIAIVNARTEAYHALLLNEYNEEADRYAMSLLKQVKPNAAAIHKDMQLFSTDDIALAYLHGVQRVAKTDN